MSSVGPLVASWRTGVVALGNSEEELLLGNAEYSKSDQTDRGASPVECEPITGFRVSLRLTEQH